MRAQTHPLPIMAAQWAPVPSSSLGPRTRLPASASCMRTLDDAGTVLSSLLCKSTTEPTAAQALPHAASRAICRAGECCKRRL